MFTGEQVNLWGILLNRVISMLDASIAGMATIPLTGNYTLTSNNFVADEARNSILKFTGSVASVVTIPNVTKVYLVWNASSASQVISAGAGSMVTVEASDIVLVFCDAANVKTLSYGGLSLKEYIAAAALGTVGDLPAQVGNAGKFVKTDGANATWQFVASADLSDSAALLGRAVALAVSL